MGTLSGTTEKGDSVRGEYLNTNDNDPYEKRWTPDALGSYYVKFFADPEDVWAESNEENNVKVYHVDVGMSGKFKPTV